MNKFHHTEPYLLSPQHPVTVQVIGAGGNGSQVLTQLARIDKALKGLGHVGLHITLFDDDLVSEANLGRQAFSPADIGMNKASVLITRYNRFFGTDWNAMPVRFSDKVEQKHRLANITISCVDSVTARRDIQQLLYEKISGRVEPYQNRLYWMDLGNTQDRGQFVIGTISDKAKNFLPDVFMKFPEFRFQKDKDTGPSCSLVEALNKQDLFVNSLLVQVATHTLWRMFRETKINYHGAFINLKTLKIAPIYI